MATLTLTNIEKRYPNGFQAIHPLNLTVEDGEMVVLVGPSGCGKSTLLRMIAGLESISAGELCIDQQAVNQLEPGQRDIAMVFQNYALYPHMTVYNNMAYGLRNRRVPKGEIDQLVRRTATLLELDSLLARKPRQLSGGQRQRVAMGRAIVRSPKVFLFDEPLSNLDAKLRVQMRLEIKRLQRRLHTTAIYVTHDQVEAMTLGDKLVVLNQGRIEQIGTPMAIYQRPASLFVATFIGAPAMNILSARVEPDGLQIGPQTRIDCDTTALALDEVWVGIRPEHLHGDSFHPDIWLNVDMIEALGADKLVYGHLADSKDTELVVRMAGDVDVQYGQTLGIAVAAADVHLFDPVTQLRLEKSISTKVSIIGMPQVTFA